VKWVELMVGRSAVWLVDLKVEKLVEKMVEKMVAK